MILLTCNYVIMLLLVLVEGSLQFHYIIFVVKVKIIFIDIIAVISFKTGLYGNVPSKHV